MWFIQSRSAQHRHLWTQMFAMITGVVGAIWIGANIARESFLIPISLMLGTLFLLGIAIYPPLGVFAIFLLEAMRVQDPLLTEGSWFTGAKVVGIVTLVIFVAIRLAAQRLNFVSSRLTVPLLSLWAVFATSLLWSPDKVQGLDSVVSLASLIGLFLLINNLIKTKRLFQISVELLIWLTVLVLVVGGLENGLPDIFTLGRRTGYFFGNPNGLAAWLMLVSQMVIIRIWTSQKRHTKILYGILLAGFLYYLLATGSMGYWIAMLVAWFYWLLIARPVSYSRRTALLCILAIIIILATISPLIQTRVSKAMQVDSKTRTSRIADFEVSWQVSLSRPLLGTGVGGYEYAVVNLSELDPIAAQWNLAPGSAHNLYFNIMAQNGLLGLFILGWVFITIVRIARSNRQTIKDPEVRAFSEGFVAGLMGQSVASLFHSNLYFNLLWIVIGLLDVAGRVGTETPLHGKKNKSA